MKKSLLTLLVVLLGFTVVMAQNITVKGKVTGADDGKPIPGASILVKGTTTGTITDFDGNYSLKVPADGTLVFSFLGMKTIEQPVNGLKEINVTLSTSTNDLSEVRVVGYGVQRKQDITGSIAGVQGADLIKQPALTATQAIQGKVAGVQIVNSGAPGADPQVRIRGTGTILGGASPLYVVDGVITDDIRNINNSDIVSVDVLKDASAAAIYGVRGANGVIIITTRAGEKGKMKISYDGYVSANVAAHKVKMADSKLYAAYTNEALGYDGQAPAFDLNNLPPYNTDWFDAITRTGVSQNHNLSVSGGTDKATYYFSMGYKSDQGILDGNNYDRLTLRSNNTYKVAKFLEVGDNIGLSRYNSDNKPYSAFTAAYRQAPTVPVKDANGNYGFTDINNVGNPRATLDYTNNQSWGTRIQGSVYAKVDLLKHLQFKSNMGVDFSEGHGRIYNPVYTVSATQKNEISQLTLNQSTNAHWIWDNYFTYNNHWGNHRLKLMGGTTAEKYRTQFMNAARQNVPAQKNYWYLDLGDAASATNGSSGTKSTRNSYLGRVNYSFANKYLFTGTLRYDGSSMFPSNNRWATFPSIGLGWVLTQENFLKDNSWLSNLKLRGSWGKIGNDAIPSNAFIYTINSGLAYVFGPDQAYTNGGTITDIKDPNLKWEVTTEKDLGLEYGLFNNRLSGEFDYYNKLTSDALIFAPIAAIFGDPDAAYLTNKADIRNIGFEFSANWRNKVNSDFSYNIGLNMTTNKNRIERVGGGLPITGGSLSNGQVTTRTEEGQPIGSFWVYQTDGIFHNQSELDAYVNSNGQPLMPNAKPGDLKLVDRNHDGVIDDNDRYYAGSYNPKLMIGLNLGMNYKNWDFSVDSYGNFGGKIYNGKKAQRWGGENIEASLTNRWTPNNQDTNIPRASNAVPVASDYYIESGDFFRFNNLTLGYTLPKTLTEKISISRCRFYVTAQNAITLTGYSGYNPELPGQISLNSGNSDTPANTTNSGTLNSGIDLSSYPETASYLLGLNITF